jgi:regulator of RNase E activity RraA
MSELVRRLAWLDTTVVSDALEDLGLPSGIGGLRAQWGGLRLAGVARTVELEPDPGDTPGPHIATRAIAAAGAGDVVVVANGGRTDVSCWGSLLSLGSASRGLAGVVADGVCRDVAEAQTLGSRSSPAEPSRARPARVCGSVRSGPPSRSRG